MINIIFQMMHNKYPYMQKKEVEIVEEILSRLQPSNSLEWGAGYSTIYFAKFLPKGANWISIEHDKDWAHKVSGLLMSNPIFYIINIFKNKHIKILHISPNNSSWSNLNGEGSYSEFKDYIEYPDKLNFFDFILIDGRARKDCLIKAHEIVKDKGVVILHDANRKYYHEPFALFKHQMLFLDDGEDGGGLWVGSKGLDIGNVLNLDKHRLKRLANQRPTKIVIGAAGIFQRGWIPTDIEFLNILKHNDWKRYFSKNSIDAMLAEHVWEHLTKKDGVLAAKLCFEYLKCGGYLRVAVPDGFFPDSKYIEWVKPGGTGPGAYDHKILYNYRTFKEIFELAGFRVDLLEYFCEKGEFHYREWSPEEGFVHRSRRFDNRNSEDTINYTSIIIDAWKIAL